MLFFVPAICYNLNQATVARFAMSAPASAPASASWINSPKKARTEPPSNNSSPPSRGAYIDKVNAWFMMARVTVDNQGEVATGKGKFYVRHDEKHPVPNWFDDHVDQLNEAGTLISAEVIHFEPKNTTTLEVTVWRPEDAVLVWQMILEAYGANGIRNITTSGARSIVDWAAYQGYVPTLNVTGNPDLCRITVTGTTKPLSKWLECDQFGEPKFDIEIWGYHFSALDDEQYDGFMAKLNELATAFNFTINRVLIAPAPADPVAA